MNSELKDSKASNGKPSERGVGTFWQPGGAVQCPGQRGGQHKDVRQDNKVRGGGRTSF